MSRGRILSEDIAALRARVAIEDIIGERVTLRRSGGGLTGLCPFHDEGSPSFSVSPSKGLYLCFGCGESGDVITYVQKTESLTFVEAVERLADKVGFPLRYADPDPSYTPPPPGQRVRLLAMHKSATSFYCDALKKDSSAQPGWDYLRDRGFHDSDIDTFSIGYAPDQFDALLNHLKSEGYTTEEIVVGGLAVKNEENGRIYDRFRGRLMWPIKDISGDVIGFGARRIKDDDKGPKWLNTPDSPLYKKSEVLYGIDTARKHIANDRTVVVVEGYGDVMACHLSGVLQAVATCGTSFGDGHIRVVRRLLRDEQAHTGKVIFTFDGDAAGQKAALRAFKENNKFASQTYVAVAPDDMDPLDLRLSKGDQAVRDLIDQAVPLVEFALKNAMTGHDLARSEGRVNALRAMAPILAGISDVPMKLDYIRKVSGWIGLPDHTVRSATAHASKQIEPEAVSVKPTENISAVRPNPLDPLITTEREALKCLLQNGAARTGLDGLDVESFSNEAYRDVFTLIASVLADGISEDDLVEEARTRTGNELAPLINELAVEPIPAQGDKHEYQDDVLRRLRDKDAERKIASLKVKLASSSQEQQGDLLSQIMELEKARRALRLV